MTAYYNEIDPYAAQWLRNLIAAGHIASGEVDERSIVDVSADDVRGYTQCHFFAGIGGWSLALRLAGWSDDRPVWTGSCPCQPFSHAGKQQGFADSRHLWPEFRRLIKGCPPSVVFGEQVASASEWLRLVRSDLETMGYAVGAIPIQAASAGADHLRDRYWFVSDLGVTDSTGWQQGQQATKALGHGNTAFATSGILAHAHDTRSQGRRILPECASERPIGADGMANTECFGREVEIQHTKSSGITQAGIRQADVFGSNGAFEWVAGADGKQRRVKSGIRPVAHGVPNRVAKLRAFGNAIVPQVAAEFISAYMESSSELAA